MTLGQGLAAVGTPVFPSGCHHSGICKAYFQKLWLTDTNRVVLVQEGKSHD